MRLALPAILWLSAGCEFVPAAITPGDDAGGPDAGAVDAGPADAPAPPDGGACTVGGHVTGYTTTGLVLALNGAQVLPLDAGCDGCAFAFPEALACGAAYEVTLLAQPLTERCSLAAASGIAAAPVDDVAVTCVASHAVRGAVRGLAAGTMTVTLNDLEAIPVAAAAPSFAFTARLVDGAVYAVTIGDVPGHTCAVAGGVGVVAGADVIVDVRCTSYDGAGAGFAIDDSPDDACGGASTTRQSSIELSGVYVPSVVTLTIDVTHSYSSDLLIYLVHVLPGGEERRAELLDLRDDCSDDKDATDLNGAFLLIDGAPSWEAAIEAVSYGSVDGGTFAPETSLGASFTDDPVAGTWTLEIRDDDDGDTGTVRSWTLHLEL